MSNNAACRASNNRSNGAGNDGTNDCSRFNTDRGRVLR
jgi:hypothetical protein